MTVEHIPSCSSSLIGTAKASTWVSNLDAGSNAAKFSSNSGLLDPLYFDECFPNNLVLGKEARYFRELICGAAALSRTCSGSIG